VIWQSNGQQGTKSRCIIIHRHPNVSHNLDILNKSPRIAAYMPSCKVQEKVLTFIYVIH